MERQVLIEIGLTNNEADVYLALLGLGSCLVSNIVKKTSINRTNIYDLLEKLINKGLVSHITKNKKRYFFAADPKCILYYLEEKRKKINTEEEQIKEILPNLNRIKAIPPSESVQVYEGKEGIKTILEEILLSKKEILTYGSEGNFTTILKYYFSHYLKKLEKNKIHLKVIFNANDSNKISKLNNSEVRYLPKELSSPTETTITSDSVIIFIFTQKPKAIVIKSKSIVESYKNYFRVLWSSAKEIK